MKFLERDENGHYHTQTEFFKPFESIMKHSKAAIIREFALKSLEQMIRARARNIKSGWKSIFLIYSRCASPARRLPLRCDACSRALPRSPRVRCIPAPQRRRRVQ